MPLTLDETYFEGTGEIGYSTYTHQHRYLEDELAFVLATFGPTFGKVLDVGCAYGYFTQMLRAAGIDAVGIDVSTYAVGRDVSGGFVSELDFLSNPNTGFADKEFDLLVSIYTLECMERLVSLRKAAGEAARIANRIYFVTSLGSPAPHYQASQADYEAFVINEFPPPDWTVSFSDGTAFQPSRRVVILPGA